MSIRDHLAKVLGQNVFANSDIATRRFVQTRGFALSNGGFTLPKDGFSLPRNGFSLPGLQKTQGTGLVAEEMRRVNEELAKETKAADAEASDESATPVPKRARVPGRVRAIGRVSNRDEGAAFEAIRPPPDERPAVARAATPLTSDAVRDNPGTRELAARASVTREFTDRVEQSTVTSGPLHDLVKAGGKPLTGTNPVYLVRSGDRMLHFGSKAQLYEHYRQPGRKSARNTYANMHPGMKAQHDVNVIRRLTNGDEVVAVHRDVGKQVLSEGRAELPARSLSDMRRSLEKMKARTRDTKQSKEARNLQAALDAAEAPSGAGVSPRKKSVKKRVQNPRT
jgi:hypothetical protein